VWVELFPLALQQYKVGGVGNERGGGDVCPFTWLGIGNWDGDGVVRCQGGGRVMGYGGHNSGRGRHEGGALLFERALRG